MRLDPNRLNTDFSRSVLLILDAVIDIDGTLTRKVALIFLPV